MAVSSVGELIPTARRLAGCRGTPEGHMVDRMEDASALAEVLALADDRAMLVG
jgi:hypothetical protein